MADPLDTLIVGAGPAGLTAAIYLARFRRRVLVADTGDSRASWIPKSRNLPGFTQGLHGETLLERLRHQARTYGVEMRHHRVETLAANEGGFQADIGEESFTPATVILATGVVEIVPAIPGAVEAITRSLMRVCPICDGFEAQGKKVAVLGSGDHAAGEALFLRTWAADVSLVLTRDADLSDGRRDALKQFGVKVFHTALESVSLAKHQVTAICTEGGQPNHFDLVYSAFGVTAQTDLARQLGAKLDEDGRLYVGAHQETSVDGLYAAGDVVRGLNQISVAEGEASVAATAIHNRLPRNPA
ncbi:NAD(P)/FAD-dependent oxidoreductase [Caulobacter sp. S45]|uniref:NAD(P)/FAD-dependent oxidoreductase n=1 Tax=Caulobacter sp. S45 TaxID=1641861 RepID=UPI001576DBE7|nr:NAD(P)/FAD-dependent oxidoreductase [Caulobacter sp. S45]